MKRVGVAVALILSLEGTTHAAGVSPYLPLNIEPEMQSQIERVLILADQPVMTRPIAAATVLKALPKTCRIDAALCERVRAYVTRYTRKAGIAYASVEGAVSSGSAANTVDPNRYGMKEDSHWDAAGQLYWQPNDYVMLDAGAVAYEGRTDFTGSMLSLGWDFAQLDIGFRPHWFSPMTDSSMLMSTEAPTMPSVTLSNYRPLTRFGWHYELFAASMSESHDIAFGNGFTSGHPRLAGLHLDMQPAEGWSLGASRLMQYGGGLRGGGSLHDLFNAFFNPSAFDNTSASTAASQTVGNQEASFTSSLLFPGTVPFAVYFEYAGEDTSRGKNYLLGNSALSGGIHFARLWQRFDLTVEATEWQNSWYIHNIYQDGMTNDFLVTGNWFGDQRVFNDFIGGRSEMVKLGYEPSFGGLIELQYRTLQNQTYGPNVYQHFQDFSLGYSRPWQGVVVGGQIEAGHSVFGGNFERLSAFLRYDEGAHGLAGALTDALSASETDEFTEKQGEVFVDAGANANRENVDLQVATNRFNTPIKYGYHIAVGARRFVSDHSDLGARIEVDDIQDHNLIGVRALDYRYRFRSPLALSIFVGAARYALATPAYGIYYGAGLQWRNVLPGWDLGVDVRYANSIARDHLLRTDPVDIGGRNDSFYDVLSTTLSISRHF